MVVASVDDGASNAQLTRLGAHSAQGTVGLPGGEGYPLAVSADDFGHALVEYDNGFLSTELRLYGDDGTEVLGAMTLEDTAVAALTGDGTGDVIVATDTGDTITTERFASDLQTRRWIDQFTFDGDVLLDVDTVGSAPDGRIVVVFDVTLFGGNPQNRFVVRVLAP